MSAYIVGEDTIKDTLNGCHAAVQYKDQGSDLLARNVRDPKRWVSVAKSLQELNCEAVNYRYKHLEEDNVPTPVPNSMKPDFELKINSDPSKVAQLYKSMRCWLYQCAEGTVDESIGYKWVDACSAELAHWLASRNPYYDEASW